MDTSTLIKLAARNTTRRRARTLFTAGMVLVSVGLLVVALAMLDGVFGALMADGTGISGHVRLVQPGYAEREELMPLEDNLPDVEALAQKVAQLPGVVSVEPKITQGVTVTAGDQIGDVFALVVGAHESYFRDRLQAKERLIQGTWFTGATDELIAGREVVDQLHAKLGDELLMLGSTQDGSMSSVKGRLVGVVQGASLNQSILLPLEKLQYLGDLDGAATELLVFGHDLNDAKPLAARLKADPSTKGLTVQAWSEREPWTGLVKVSQTVRFVLTLIICLLTALGIWNAMMMSVLERTQEIGVLRAMGLSRPRTVGLFMVEALAIAIGGGLVGVALGAIPAWALTVHGYSLGAKVTSTSTIPIRETIHAALSPQVMVSAFALGLLMALLGSLLPALRASSIQPVAAMRAGR